MVKPFIKWAGGKGQLLTQLEARMPKQIYDEEFTYIEPFVGGGAMLIFMLQKFQNIKNVIINDINTTLVNAYLTIRDNPDDLILRLSEIQDEYYSLVNEEARKEYYLKARYDYNENENDVIKKTALFIFLNRTCFNGLYRENSHGKFNVPFGRYHNPIICDSDNIKGIQALFSNVDILILNKDFSETANYISPNLTFFYFDPPYRPLNETSSFNSYSKQVFDDSKQEELASFCRNINKRNQCLWMLSNSDCSAKNPEDTFFESIYKGFSIDRVYASRNINANPRKRGKLTELLITNYSITK